MGKARCSWLGLQLLATLLLLLMTAAADAATVSGTVTNNTAVAGRVFLVGNWSGGGSAGWGKSLTVAANNTATYSIQGVPDGTYTVSAFLDTQNRGRQFANDPSGSSAQFTVSGGANALNVNMSLSAPTATAVQPPVSVTVVPGNGGVLVMWDPAKDTSNRAIAPDYRVYWSTSANPGPLNMTGGGTSGDLLMQADTDVYFKGFPNNTTLYFSVAAKLNGVESTTVNGNGGAPVVIGPKAGGVAVSGTVTSSGATLGASTPLYIAITDTSTGAPQYVGLVNSPSASQAYSIPGVLPGNRGIYAIVDINNNGIIDLGDLTNTESNGVPVTVASTAVTNANVALVGADANVSVRTEHWKQGAADGYKLNPQAGANRKRPVNATVSGPNLTTFDMAVSSWGPLEAWPALTARPTLTPADTYSFAMEYSDGTSTGASPLTAQVNAVLDSFATATSPVGYVPFPFSSGNFTWSAPASPPSPYTYGFWLSVPGFSDDGFYNMPSSTTNATYTAFTGYVDGTRYDWSIAVKDSFGNMAQTQADFTPTTSPVITGFTPAIGGPGTAVTITGFNFDVTAANNSVTFPGSFTATPSSASATQLVVAVPSNAATSSGPISVTVGTKSGQSSGTFTIDATPPVTTASPVGGTQTGPINVTLTANEAATIYYTTNGVDPTYPVSGQTQTYSTPIPISSVTTALKYFARDSYGNKEAVQTQIYFYGTPTTLTLAVDNSSITYGQTVTATATLIPAAATGTVTFFVDNVQSGAPVPVSAGTAQVVISGLTATGGTPHAIQALYGGDTTYAGSGNSTSVTVAKAASTVTVNVNTYTYNGSPQGPATASVTGSSGAVTWSYAGVSGTTYGPSATLPVNAGSYTATATVAADANYNSASSSATAFTIAMASQTITVTSAAPASAAYNATFTVAATAPGGTVAYSSGSPAVCTNVGATFTMVAPSGTCIVQYDQAGNANYNAAPQVTSNTTATKANQTITFAALAPKNTIDPPFNLTATASSNLPISYTSSNTAVAAVSGSTVTLGVAGTAIITASQAGDANWNAATDVLQTLTVTVGQTITVTFAPATADYNSQFTVVASSNSGLPLTYSSGSQAVCVNSGATFTMLTGTGTCIVQYDQPGNGTFDPAPRVTSSVTAVKIAQGAVTVTAPASATYGQTGLSAVASGGNGTGSYSYDAGTSTACSVNATTGALTITSGTGTCSITATRQGDTNYNASSASTAGTVAISKAAATVTLSGLNPTYTGSALAATATTSPAGLTVNTTYGGSATAPANAGTYAVVATINDTNYQGSATGNLVIAKATATVTLSNLTQTADGTPKGVTITTTPANLAVNVTYNTSAAIPTTAGTYNVVATVNDANYQGSATATLNVVAYGDIAGTTGGSDGQVNIVDAYNYLLISLKLSPAPAYTGNLLLAPIVAGKPTAVPGSRSVNILDVRAMLEKVAGLW